MATSVVRHVYSNRSSRVAVPARDPAIAASPRLCHTGGKPAMLDSEGNDTTPVVTETYLAEVYVPDNVTVTGIAVLNGSAVDGNLCVGLYDASGLKLAQSAETAQADIDTYQRVPFAAAIAVVPGTYYVAVQCDDTDARINTHIFGNFGAGKLTSQTFGTMPAATMPTTFTTALGPIASLY